MTKANRVISKPPIGTPINDYLQSRDFYYNRTWTLTEGVMLTCVNGEWMSEGEFRERWPIQNKLSFIFRDSPDTTKIN